MSPETISIHALIAPPEMSGHDNVVHWCSLFRSKDQLSYVRKIQSNLKSFYILIDFNISQRNLGACKDCNYIITDFIELLLDYYQASLNTF